MLLAHQAAALANAMAVRESGNDAAGKYCVGSVFCLLCLCCVLRSGHFVSACSEFVEPLVARCSC